MINIIEELRQDKKQKKVAVTLFLNKNNYKEVREYLKIKNKDKDKAKITVSNIIDFYLEDTLKKEKGGSVYGRELKRSYRKVEVAELPEIQTS